ncbi:RloB domain-containing protein [Sporolactobacillus nakayamae]|uniref:RloB-like protein n=1 Tax=Sporolactobacillus nakayamae TaxID=269670 RepID=A0A1I2UEA3_9BACL|nr:RloB domain-containing protein [Sporolactobacillus nakayamae]SFG75502.1 RloB-like protein [Sporolactobacillus nakayamae]
MTARKLTNTFYFTVEGETEKWYLEWLQKQINSNPDAKYKVFIDSKVEKSPVKRVKSMSNISKIKITHLFDYESNSASHKTQFLRTLDSLKEASKLKQIKYRSGYSNLTFELWMVLHRQNCG